MGEDDNDIGSDFDRRVYTACQEVREGGIGEIEVEEVTTLDIDREIRITFTVRREVRHIKLMEE